MKLSMYDPESGLFTGAKVTGPPEWVHDQVPTGLAALEGDFDHLSQRVDLDTGAVVDYVPPKPADDELVTYAWDTDSRRWVGTRTTAAYWQATRAERNRRLTASDWIVARSAEAGQPVPAAWQAYRQALRDITEQPDPLQITWPTPPTA